VSVDEALRAATWLPQMEGSQPRCVHSALSIMVPHSLPPFTESQLAENPHNPIDQSPSHNFHPQCKQWPRWHIANCTHINAGFTSRLVHRLDRETSGALVVARTPDAAAWLSACFREHAESAGAAVAVMSPRGSAPADRPSAHPSTRQEGRRVSREERGNRSRKGDRFPARDGGSAKPSPAAVTGGAAVQRTYWAIVETGDLSGGALPASGRIDAAIWGGGGSGSSGGDDPSGGGGAWRPAATAFSVLRQGGGYAWLELRPETGWDCSA